MKCTYCRSDSKYPDRQKNGGRCGACGHRFAFEPKTERFGGRMVWDGLFARAIRDVSAQETLPFTERQLYYEVCRKLWRPGVGADAVFLAGGSLVGSAAAAALVTPWFLLAGAAGIAGGLWIERRRRQRPRVPPVSFGEFEARMLGRWIRIHGLPPLLVRPGAGEPARLPEDAEPDLTAYSFDRALVTEREDLAAMLVAGRFHFENNCAILSEDGYPGELAATILAMLRRNPRLHVFAVHDASPHGCGLALRLRSEEWFPDPKVALFDLGLRPAHAAALKLFVSQGRPLPLPAAVRGSLPEPEAAWLEAGSWAEVSEFRPARLMRSLYQGFARADREHEAGGEAGTGGDDVVWIHTPGADVYAADSFG